MNASTEFPADHEPLVETLAELNLRFANALLPLAAILALFCLLGIIGNTIVIVVFSFSPEYRGTNFKTFVICLGITDLLSCVTLMPAEIIKTRNYFWFPSPVTCKVKCFFNVFAMTSAALVLLVICIDRYRKVCQPLKKQIWPGLAVKILVAVLTFSFMVSLPAPVMCGIQQSNKTNIYGTNTTVFVCSAEEQYQRHTGRFVYKFGMSALLVIVSIAFIVMYVFIIKTVVRHWGRGPGESVRFEVRETRSPEVSEAERISPDNQDDVFKANPVEYPGKDTNRVSIKITDKRAVSRKESDLSNSSSANKTRVEAKCSIASSNLSYKYRYKAFRSFSSSSSASRRRSSSGMSGKIPYKTLIWFILTLIFLVTFCINAGLSFLSTREHLFEPVSILWFQIFLRLYFINNIINPVIYAALDKRFKSSSKYLFQKMKSKICKC
ncbi:G-protein coupled receptor 84-like [Mya arenaria]|nr:G-protein coupled receptor 84-like [Mya arenaria]XP_052771514.1 G-protein coupled receptor 84-like [Mya arenaria]